MQKLNIRRNGEGVLPLRRLTQISALLKFNAPNPAISNTGSMGSLRASSDSGKAPTGLYFGVPGTTDGDSKALVARATGINTVGSMLILRGETMINLAVDDAVLVFSVDDGTRDDSRDMEFLPALMERSAPSVAEDAPEADIKREVVLNERLQHVKAKYDLTCPWNWVYGSTGKASETAPTTSDIASMPRSFAHVR